MEFVVKVSKRGPLGKDAQAPPWDISVRVADDDAELILPSRRVSLEGGLRDASDAIESFCREKAE
jgi:hypothetical protein